MLYFLREAAASKSEPNSTEESKSEKKGPAQERDDASKKHRPLDQKRDVELKVQDTSEKTETSEKKPGRQATNKYRGTVAVRYDSRKLKIRSKDILDEACLFLL